MKIKTYQVVIIGLFLALGILFRPEITKALNLSVVGWEEINSITTGMLVDGVVTTNKIANNASEASRVENWLDNTTYTIDTPSGANGSLTIDPQITVVVPNGKAYYYFLKYEGQLAYIYSNRVGSLSKFRANLRITPLSGTTEIGNWYEAVATGFRADWSALGDNSYWASPYQSTWVVRLTEGTHNIKFRLDLITDGTMNSGDIFYHRVQVMRAL